MCLLPRSPATLSFVWVRVCRWTRSLLSFKFWLDWLVVSVQNSSVPIHKCWGHRHALPRPAWMLGIHVQFLILGQQTPYSLNYIPNLMSIVFFFIFKGNGKNIWHAYVCIHICYIESLYLPVFSGEKGKCIKDICKLMVIMDLKSQWLEQWELTVCGFFLRLKTMQVFFKTFFSLGKKSQ